MYRAGMLRHLQSVTGEMGEIPADSDPLLEGFERRSGRSRLHVVELDVLMDKIANRLHAPPAGRGFAE